jgi:hypothetical protein
MMTKALAVAERKQRGRQLNPKVDGLLEHVSMSQ